MLRDKDPLESIFQCQQYSLNNPIYTNKEEKARHKLKRAWENAPENIKTDFIQDVLNNRTLSKTGKN